MYSGPGPVIATPARKSFQRPVKVRERETKLKVAVTDPLAGHPEVQFKRGLTAADIYPLSQYLYEQQEPMKIRLAKFLPPVKASADEINWDMVTDRRGVSSYTVAQLTDIARQRGLTTTSKLKGELVDMLWDDKERRERAKRQLS